MVKVLSFRFQQCFGPFTMLLVEGSSERDFLDIYLTTFFGVRKFKNLHLENCKKNSENIFPC